MMFMYLIRNKKYALKIRNIINIVVQHASMAVYVI